MLFWLLGSMKRYWRHMAALFVVLAAIAGLNIAEPTLMGRLTSAIFTGGRGLGVPSFLGLGQAPPADGAGAIQFLLEREGGFTPEQSAALKRAAGKYLAGLGRPIWRDYRGQIRLAISPRPGLRIQPSAIAEMIARSSDSAVPGIKVYVPAEMPAAAGRVIFPGVPTVFLVLILLILVFLLKIGAGFAQACLGATVSSGTIRDIRAQLHNHLQRLSLGFFERQQTGNLMSRLTFDVATLQGFIDAVSTDLFVDLLTVLAGLAYAFLRINWLLATVTIIAMGVLSLPVAAVGRKLRRVGGALQARWADMTSILQETIAGMRVVKAFQLENLIRQRFGRENESVFRASLRRAKLSGFLVPFVEFLASVVLALFVWFGVAEMNAGRLLPDQLFTFIFLVGFIANPVKRLSRSYSQIQHALAAGERVYELLAQQPTVAEAPQAVPLPQLRGQVRFDRVSFAYGDGPLVLQEIDLTVEPGEILALVGPSGAGKTSLVNLVPRFYDPVAGRILVDGRDLREVQIASLRAQLGIVPQETLLFRASVAENIGYGRPGAPRAEIIAAAKAANAHEFISALPDGYETMVGERGQTLSGGQRQRIAIARALLRDPRLLILDEATSSLDAESEALVQEALERLMEGRTTFVIAHRLSTVRKASRLAVLVAGRLAELGTHAELMQKGGVYARLYEQQWRGAG